jgi:hypothetical protein
VWVLSLPAQTLGPPTAIRGGRTLVGTVAGYAVVDAGGELSSIIEHRDFCRVDPFAPTVTPAGRLIHHGHDGRVDVLQDGRWHTLWDNGPTLAPVPYPDDSLAIVPVGHEPVHRVRMDGSTLWTTPLPFARSSGWPLPVVSSRGELAIADREAREACFLDHAGKLLGRIQQHAQLAEHVDGGWVAASEAGLERWRRNGTRQWRQQWGADTAYPQFGPAGALRQPVVDAFGSIYVPTPRGVMGFGPRGEGRFSTRLEGAVPSPLAIVEDGLLAFVYGDRLVLVC